MELPMRTNIEIDDDLVAEAMAVFGLKTKKATVEEALRRALRQAKQRQALEELKGIGWEGDLEAMREGRLFEPLA
jgi:Arc/MetJ family transcription regulator